MKIIKNKTKNKKEPVNLRKEAERRLKGTQSRSEQLDTNPATLSLVHELEVHQIELEMQNAELESARDSMAVMLEKYMNLYDFSPVGHFSMDPKGTITDANLTAASLFEIERSRLIERNFLDFIDSSSKAHFTQFLDNVFKEGGNHFTELPIVTLSGEMRLTGVQAISLPSLATKAPRCRLALSDITELKKATVAKKRLDDLVRVNRELEEEILQRRSAEKALKQSERRLNLLLKESQHMQETLRQLSHEVIEAQESERRRISVELHDEITQTLVSINSELGGLLNEEYPIEKILRIQKLVEKSINGIHGFAMELRPTLLDDLGLVAAVKAYIKNFEERSDLTVNFSPCLDVAELADDYSAVLFRVIQSALGNIIQHAEASHVNIKIDECEGQLRLDIHDDGKSFDVNAVMKANKHRRMGIVGMRERVESVNGSFVILSAPETGTSIRAILPSLRGNGNFQRSRQLKDKNITLLLADDHAVVRQGFRQLLDSEPDITVLLEVANGRDAVAEALRHKPDIVLMDCAMPLLNGLEATRQIVNADPKIKILMLSAHMEDAYVDRALQAGASAFVLKQASGNTLAGAVRTVMGGGIYLSPEVKNRRRELPIPTKCSKFHKTWPELTKREKEVLQLIAEGMPNKQTADVLKISIKTVEKHRTNLMRKLNIHNTAGLTRYAITAGMIEGGEWEPLADGVRSGNRSEES